MKYFCLLLILFITTSAKAQDVHHFIQLGTTANAYKGDLQDSYAIWGSSFHLGLKFNKKHRLNGSFTLSMGSITGQNINPEFRNLENTSLQPNSFFRSSIISGQYNLHVNLLKSQQWNVFLSQGVGLLRYNPKDDLGNSLIDMNNTRAPNEGYNTVSIMFPTQAGLSYTLKNNFGFAMHGGFLNTLTDYIDNISDLGSKKGNDNIFVVRFSLLVPIKFLERKDI